MFSVSTQAVVVCLGCVGVGLSAASIGAAESKETKSEKSRKSGETVSVQTNKPPISPEQFNPDPGVPPVRPRNKIDETRFDLKVQISTNATATNLLFNPDPGARNSLATNSLYKTNFGVAPILGPQPSLTNLAGQPDIRSVEIQPQPATPDDHFGQEPLSSPEKLPREGVTLNPKPAVKFENPDYPLAFQHQGYPEGAEPVTNRWRIGFSPWNRYTRGQVEGPYLSPPALWHPYRQSTLKGDYPIFGQDIFLNLTAESQTEFEARRLPTKSGISSARPFSSEFYGEGDQLFVQNNFAFTMDLFRGETVFQPVHWALRLQPVVNINFLDSPETGVVNADPRGGRAKASDPRVQRDLSNINIDDLLNGELEPAPNDLAGTERTQRLRSYFAMQQMFLELHVADLSETYDFLASRVGNQVFNSDFRGFVFNEVNLGARLFGNYDNNRFQYNAAIFDMREKDSNSELNTFDARDQRVFVANIYRQDFLTPGYTAQLSFHANLDQGDIHYDENDNITRPAPIGTVRPHDVRAYYLGWAGDGHIGKLNIDHAFYQALGSDDFNGIAGRKTHIDARMGALELSVDHDWARFKTSFFYASGDDNPDDATASGFDSIVDNPNFTGGPFSYYVRQGFNFGGTAVSLKTRNSLLPSLRTSKNEGQANFVNPGVFVYGLGTELELTPKLRTFINVNYIRFDTTAVLKEVLVTDKVDEEFGLDTSIGFQYRPLLTDNIIISFGFGALIPGKGFRDIYRRNPDPVPGYNSFEGAGKADSFYYSSILALRLSY